MHLPRGSSGASALDVAVTAAHRAGGVLVERFHGPKAITYKGPHNPVTDADLMAEKACLEVLRDEFPGSGILSEESAPVAGDSGYTWVVDPLDGTRNYAAGIPHFAVVVALARGDQVLLGVTYDPLLDETFTAEAGGPALLNGDPISVSAKDDISDCVLAFDMGYASQRALQALHMVTSMWPRFQSLRLLGSAALGLAYAACGRVDLYFHHHLSPWDIASGLPLVAAAGGRTVTRCGSPAGLRSDSVAASSPSLVDAFLAATEGAAWRK